MIDKSTIHPPYKLLWCEKDTEPTEADFEKKGETQSSIVEYLYIAFPVNDTDVLWIKHKDGKCKLGELLNR